MPPRVAPVESSLVLVRMLRSLRSRSSSLTLPSSRYRRKIDLTSSASSFDDGDFAVLHLIAEGQGASDPQTLALGCRDLVADPLRGDLTLELGKGQKDIERQPAHRGRGIELLGDRDK